MSCTTVHPVGGFVTPQNIWADSDVIIDKGCHNQQAKNHEQDGGYWPEVCGNFTEDWAEACVSLTVVAAGTMHGFGTDLIKNQAI